MNKKTVNYVSASQLGFYKFCPVAYKYRYIDGEPRDPGSIYTAYGSALHSALAVNYRQKIKSRKDLLAEELHKEFLKVFAEQCTKAGVAPSLTTKEMEMSSEEVLINYMKLIAPTIQPTHVEYKFEIPLKNFPFTVLGYMDIIEEGGWIIDHKTAGKTFKRDWQQSRVDKDIQFTWYAMAYRKLFGKEEAGIRADIIPRDPSKSPLTRVSSRTNTQILNVLQTAHTIEAIAKNDLFVPNWDSCSSCPFKDNCERSIYA